MGRSTRVAIALTGLASAFGGLACGAPRPPLGCADGGLPCAEQVTAFQCDELAAGTLPPDAQEVEWMLQGAKIPQLDEPPVSLVSWCSGTLTAAGLTMHVELFQGIEGGYLHVPGRDRVWFQAAPEDPSYASARMCVEGDLPPMESASCTSLEKGAPFDAGQFNQIYVHATRADRQRFGAPDHPIAVCAATARHGVPYRIDFFRGGKGWLRLPSEKRLCFVSG